jgi:hypothetical protein
VRLPNFSNVRGSCSPAGNKEHLAAVERELKNIDDALSRLEVNDAPPTAPMLPLIVGQTMARGAAVDALNAWRRTSAAPSGNNE